MDLNKVILVDMDGVLCDYAAGFDLCWAGAYPDRPTRESLGELARYQVQDAFPPEWKSDIYRILREQRFFRDLPPIEGGVKALKEMKKEGWEPFICTAPMTSSKFCMSDKQAWVDKYLGYNWVRRRILASNKALVRGLCLIDDNPKFADPDPEPLWQWVVFDRPYNRHIEDRPRLCDWQQWREAVAACR
jgi:5'-nucleotidase